MATIKTARKPVEKAAGASKKSLAFVKGRGAASVVKKGSTVNALVLSIGAEKPESQMTPMEKMARLQIGISKKELENLKSRASLDYDKLASLLLVTRATLINKQSTQKFNPALSERILSLAEIYSFGYQVFEDDAAFNHWMFRENRALGGRMPYEVCNNQFGREEVKNIIGRIHYGVYS